MFRFDVSGRQPWLLKTFLCLHLLRLAGTAVLALLHSCSLQLCGLAFALLHFPALPSRPSSLDL